MSNLKNIFIKPVIFMTVMTIFFQLLILLICLANYVPSPTSHFNITAPSLELTSENGNNSQIAIKAVNPGYNTEVGKNAGEFIELVNLSGEPQPLDNLAVIYTAKPANSSSIGKSTVLFFFPKGSRFIGETILMRYKDSPETTENSQDLTYDTSLAMTGSLSLVRLADSAKIEDLSGTIDFAVFGEVENSVCWLGGENCLPVFSTTVKSRSYTTIVRNEDTGEYEHVANYLPIYNPDELNLFLPPENTDASTSQTQHQAEKTTTSAQPTSTVFDVEKDAQCQGLIFSEILSYYDEDEKEQFIEFYNSANSDINLDGCKVKYKNKYYDLGNGSSRNTIGALDYYVLQPEFRLTKNPNTENILELYDANGTIIDVLTYPHGQKKAASYAQIGYESDGTEDWRVTYAVTPGEPNIYQQYRSCTDGKVINESTGNCVKAATMSSALADCPAGKYRNPTTGRCKNIESDDETTECKEGYERNPETGRCRKIKDNNGTEYPVIPITGQEEKSVFIGFIAIIGIAILGAGYVIFQFRCEIVYFFRKIISKLIK